MASGVKQVLDLRRLRRARGANQLAHPDWPGLTIRLADLRM